MVNNEFIQRLRKQYKKAIANNEQVFMFDGREFYVPYVKYLLEYHDGK